MRKNDKTAGLGSPADRSRFVGFLRSSGDALPYRLFKKNEKRRSLANDTRTSALDQAFDFRFRGHRSIARRRLRQRSVRGTIFDRFCRITMLQESVDQTGCKAIATTDAVENLEVFPISRFIELAVRPADRAPIVDRSRFHRSKSCTGRLEIRELLHNTLNHLLELIDFDRRNVFVNPFNFKSETGSVILFVSDHHIDLSGNAAVNLLRLLLATDRIPQRRTIVQVIGNNRSVLLCRRNSFFNNGCGRLRKSGVNPAGMEPANAILTKKLIPIDIARLHLGGRRMSAVGDSDRTANSKSALRKVQAISNFPPEAIERYPLDIRRINATLQNKIFDQPADVVVGKSRNDTGPQSKATAHSAGHIVFSAPFPGSERTGCPHPPLTGVETKHNFAERDEIVFALISRFNFKCRHSFS